MPSKPVPPDTPVEEADRRLQEFLRDFYPVFPDYLPGKDIEVREISASKQNKTS